TIPAMTRTAAMIHNRVAAPPLTATRAPRTASNALMSSLPFVCLRVPNPLGRAPGRAVDHVGGGRRLGDLLERLAHLALGGRRHRHVAERKDSHQLVVLHDRE